MKKLREFVIGCMVGVLYLIIQSILRHDVYSSHIKHKVNTYKQMIKTTRSRYE